MFSQTSKDIASIKEAYESVYIQEDTEQLNELIGAAIGAGFGYLAGRAAKGFAQGVSGSGDKPKPTPTKSQFAGARDANFARVQNIKGSPVVGSKPSGGSPAARPTGNAPSARPSGASATPSRPSGGSPTKPASTAKPAASAGQTGDKAKDMQTWAKANPTLAAKVKPGQSGYGAIQQARAATGGEAAAKPAAKLDTGKVTRTAFSASTPALGNPLSSSAATAATTKPVDTVTPAQSKIAAAPKPIPMGSKKPGSMLEEVDTFDVVLEYLVSEGYADTNEAALAIMANMSEEWREEIICEKKGERPRGLPYGPVGKKFRELTVPQRKKMSERGKEHTRAAMGSGEEYSGSHAKSSAIDSALRSKRLGGRG